MRAEDTSDTWSSAIKIEVPIISFFDRVRLCFTPLQIKETEDGTVYSLEDETA